MFSFQVGRRIFPNQRSLDENGNKGLEEERRLGYVKQQEQEKLYISYVNLKTT